MHNLLYKKTYSGIFFVSATLAIVLGGIYTKTTDVTKAPYTLLTPLPCNAGLGGTNCTTVNGSSVMTSIDLADFISYAYKLMLALAVVLAVIMITIGGFEYMLSGAMDTKSDAKKKITDAVLGLLLALCSYLILYTIDPNLVSTSNLCIPPIGQTTCTGTQTTTSPTTTNNTPAAPPTTPDTTQPDSTYTPID